MEDVKLDGKTAIVTGANTGIGLETARGLASRGARVILACRSRERAEEACRDITSSTGNDAVEVKLLDLSSFRSVREFADDVNRSVDRLDLLVNNAGVMCKHRRITEDGHEKTFGVNHLGHFLLTNLLLDKLKASAPARIVIVSSDFHRYGAVNFKDLEITRCYTSMKSYGASKTANILHGVHLASLLQGTGVTTYSLCPGAVRTDIWQDYSGNCCCMCTFRLFLCCCCTRYLPVEEGARTPLYCCLEPSIAAHSGRYYDSCTDVPATDHASDPVIAKQLWDVSMELCGAERDIERETSPLLVEKPVSFVTPSTGEKTVSFVTPSTGEKSVSFVTPSTEDKVVSFVTPSKGEKTVSFVTPSIEDKVVSFVTSSKGEKTVSFVTPSTEDKVVSFVTPSKGEKTVSFVTPTTEDKVVSFVTPSTEEMSISFVTPSAGEKAVPFVTPSTEK